MRSEGDLFPHQREAVDSVEQRLRQYGGALLADAAGTGKSWIAVAVARRWESLGAGVSIVVPKPLQQQWWVLLNAWKCNAAVTTHDAVRPADAADLVIVDEAHRFRNPSTRRYRRLAVHCSAASVLLITATPAVNDPEDLVRMLGIFLEDDALAEYGLPSIDEALERDAIEEIGSACSRFVVRRRGREELAVAIPQLKEVTVRYPLPENWNVILERLQRLEFPGAARDSAGSMRALLRRRYLSSPAALRGTIERQLKYLARLADAERRGRVLMREMHRRALEDVEGEQAMLFPDAFCEEAAHGSHSSHFEIERLRDLLSRLRDRDEDPKFEALAAALDVHTPALVFTESAETARYLWTRLSIHRRCGLITSASAKDASGEARSLPELFASFRAGALDLLVTTDVAAEGVDLQNARTVVHYDLAWSRVRLEQRVARAARIGSPHQLVTSVLMVPEGDSATTLDIIAEKERRCARLDAPTGPAGTTGRFCIPRIARTDPQHRLARALVSSGAMDLELAAALARRYRAGVEVQLREIQERGRLPIGVLKRSIRRAVASQRASRRVFPEGERPVNHAASEEVARLW